MYFDLDFQSFNHQTVVKQSPYEQMVLLKTTG